MPLLSFLERRLVGLLVPLMVLTASGCGSEADRPVVDFTKTLCHTRPGEAPPPQPALRGAVAAMISPKETFDLYRQLFEYVSQRMGKNLEFVQRRTYGELSALLGRGEIDVALICSGPYALGREKFGFEPLAVPLVKGSHCYYSYLIVHQESPITRLDDLRGHSFAFTDPDSNTGKLVPTYWLAELRERPETFFKNTIFTYSHDNAIMAVSRGLVDGAAVESLVYDYYKVKNPEFTARTKIIRTSEPYGLPPLVASGHLPPQDKERLRKVLLTMHEDPAGKKILEGLIIDRFVPLQEEWYEPIRRLHRRLLQEQFLMG